MGSEKRFFLSLDNAAKIYPAVRTKKWSNIFRLSVTLTEPIDPKLLQSALNVTVKRFPSVAMGLRRGFFWYRLEEIDKAPQVIPDGPYPCSGMTRAEVRKCAFRVLYKGNRIAVEFFHVLTDGNGGLIFLKTLTAEYLSQKNGVKIPFEMGVYDRAEEPKESEFEDSFLKNNGAVSKSRREKDSYRLHGTGTDGFLYLTTGIVNLEEVLNVSKQHHVTLTVLLVSAMIYSVMKIQDGETTLKRRQKPVKVLIPVNLRNYFDSNSMRNFVLYITPGIEANTGEFTFDEIVQLIHHQMKLQLTEKQMRMRITANVKAEKNYFIKKLPLFIKNIGLKIIYASVGERKSCLTLSNLGAVSIPEQMESFVERFDFNLGVQLKSVNNCGILSYKNHMYINMIRSIEEPKLEDSFFSVLADMGIGVTVEKNRKE
ncbi:MAG: hypothetical protein J6N52_05430 [Clostridia bacterium]|nr:hypothetical protein [Clostridia bacterium]